MAAAKGSPCEGAVWSATAATAVTTAVVLGDGDRDFADPFLQWWWKQYHTYHIIINKRLFSEPPYSSRKGHLFEHQPFHTRIALFRATVSIVLTEGAPTSTFSHKNGSFQSHHNLLAHAGFDLTTGPLARGQLDSCRAT